LLAPSTICHLSFVICHSALAAPFPGMVHVIWYVILGVIVGALGHWGMHIHVKLWQTILLAIIGSTVGGLVARIVSRPSPKALFQTSGLILSIVGVAVALFVLRRFPLSMP
jgi:uncharacterized membrane protein YeaQ/YmgE (transglycosylase-associated protein family)